MGSPALRKHAFPEAGAARAFFHQLGRNLAGPLIREMVYWMRDRIREDRPQALLFLGRDGGIIQEVWQLLEPLGKDAPPDHYLPASRRALRMAALEKVDSDFLHLLTHHAEGLPWKELYHSLHIPEVSVAEAMGNCPGIHPDQPYHRGLGQAAGKVLKRLEPVILERAREEREAFLSYLERFPVENWRRVGIIDIGWHGSLQVALGELLRQKSPALQTYGYYLALLEEANGRNDSRDRMAGSHVHLGQPEETAREMKAVVELVEFLFSSTRPSLICYESNAREQAQPVFLEELRSEYQLQAIRDLREGILACAGSPRQCRSGAWDRLRRLAFTPTTEEVRFLGPLQARRGFGRAGLMQPFAQPGPCILNLLCWPRLYRDYKEALWRDGFWSALSRPEKRLLRLISPKGTRRFTIQRQS